MKRIHFMLILLFILVVAAIVILPPYIRTELRRRQTQLFMTQMQQIKQMPQEMGNKNAKVIIEVAMPPFACAATGILQTLEELTKKYPEKLYVKFVPYGMPQPAKGKGGKFCIGLLVNGKSEFEVNKRKVVLQGPMGHGPRVYTKADLEEIVRQEVEKKYGPPGAPKKS